MRSQTERLSRRLFAILDQTLSLTTSNELPTGTVPEGADCDPVLFDLPAITPKTELHHNSGI